MDNIAISSVSGGSITVDSRLSADSKAVVGTPGGASISLLSIKPSVSQAKSNATVNATLNNLYMDGKNTNVTVSSALTRDKAYADVVNGLNVALANVTVVNTSADASGKVNSLLKANSANFRAKDVNVTTTYDADSDAVVKATGATIGGFNASFNSAQTDTTVNATAKLINDNSYLAFNSLKVAVNGKVASDADATLPFTATLRLLKAR